MYWKKEKAQWPVWESTVDQYRNCDECWLFVTSTFQTHLIRLPVEPPNRSALYCVFEVIAQNLVYTRIWCKSWVPWSFSNSCLQKVNLHDVSFEDTQTRLLFIPHVLLSTQFKKQISISLKTCFYQDPPPNLNFQEDLTCFVYLFS